MFSRVLWLAILVSSILQVISSERPTREREDKSIVLLERCGFIGREYKIISQNSVILSVIRATNPLFHEGEHGLENKQPIVYYQGTTLGSSLALENWHGVRPRDFSHLDAHKLTREQLLQEVGSDLSSRNLLFLALNFGHEVWIVNRRGFTGSRRRVQDQNRTLADAFRSMPDTLLGFKYLGGLSTTGGLDLGRPRGESGVRIQNSSNMRSMTENLPPGLPPTTGKFDATQWLTSEMARLLNQSKSDDEKVRALFSPLPFIKMPEGLLLFTDENFQRDFIDSFNPDFWSFSLDEQAKYDLPNVIDFVRETTGAKRVHLIGLSCGAAIILLGHAENPKLAEKVGASVLWAPSINLGSGGDIVHQMSQIVPFLQELVSPFPFLFLNKPLQNMSKLICTSSKAMLKTCRLLYDSVFGYSGKQSRMGSQWWFNTFVSSPANELRHLGQMAHTNLTCKFNFNTFKKNLEVYGQTRPPCYNFSRITTPDLFFYISNDDRLVSLQGIKVTLKQLTVKHRLEHISEKGIHFNHLGYIVHKQNTRLAVVPTLKDIALVEARGAQSEPSVQGTSET